MPTDMMESGRYHAAVTTGDVWICYPWEAKYEVEPEPLVSSRLMSFRDIDEHDRLAKEFPLI